MPVTKYADLPIAEDGTGWDSGAADTRLREKCGMDGEEPDWEAYSVGFLWTAEMPPAKLGDCKLPFADVIDGKLSAVPAGLSAAVGAINGARGGVKLPDEDFDGVKKHVAKYYKKMGAEDPWAKAARPDTEQTGADMGTLEEKAAPRIEYKQVLLEVKEDMVDFVERTFTGYAAAIGNRDEGGDIIIPGAFANTLPRVAAGKVKLMDDHDYWGGTESVIGKVLTAVEDDHGLFCTFYVSKCHDGDAILAKIADGALDALSIGYEVLDQECIVDPITKEETRYLKEIKLWEVSVVVWGMNPLALITPGSVKSLDDLLAIMPALVKAGARNSSADATVIQECIDKLTMLLADTSTPTEGEEGKAAAAVPEVTEASGDADELAAEAGASAADEEAKAAQEAAAAKEAQCEEIMAELRAGLVLLGL